MNTASKRWVTLTVSAVLCGATGALAITESEMPREFAHGVVRYMSGGVGTEEQDAMKRVAPSYPLELQFVMRGNTEGSTRRFYTAGVNVTIRNRAGEIVLKTTAAGPFLLAWLPDGEYTISAMDDGRARTLRVRVDKARHQTFVFEWSA